MAGNVMTFLPGQEPGPYALGTPYHPDRLDALAAHKLRMQRMPTGHEVAAKFPWLRKLEERIDNGDQVTLRRAGWPATFYNNSDHLVEVHEIRFHYDMAASQYIDYRTALWVKMEIPPRRIINSEWLPIGCLNTEVDRLLLANMDTFCYELPAPYVLQRANPFVIDVRHNAVFDPNNAASNNWVIIAGLHGKGYYDGEPISLMKPVRGWDTPNGVANQWQSIQFDDEQDRTLRDAWITHLTVGSALSNNSANVLEALEIRPHAPEGPPWHQEEFFRLRDLSEQVGERAIFGRNIIHRPVVPYILDKGEGLNVTIWNRGGTSTTVSVTLRGAQRSRR